MRAGQKRTRHGMMTLLIVLALFLWVIVLSSNPVNSASSTPTADQEATPMSQAIIDDITIGLMGWVQDAATPGRWNATIRAASAAALPVQFVPGLISLTAVASGATIAIAPLPDSSLPCTLQPGERATLTLLFQLEPGQTAVSLTIGLLEENRSGAHVVFPLGSGAASATGGDGAAGADARGGDAIGADATPPSMPAAPATPGSAASPEAGDCAH